MYEKKILKEKECLEKNIKIFKNRKENFEKNNSKLNDNLNKLDKQMNLVNLKNYLLEHEKKTFYEINIFLNCSKNVVEDKLDNVNKIFSVLNSTNNYKNKNNTHFLTTIPKDKETPLPTYYDKTLITEKSTPIKTKIYETILNTNSDLQSVNKFSTSMLNNPINAETKSTNVTIKNSITSNESGQNQGSLNPYLNSYNFHKKQVSGNNPIITNIIAKAKLSMISNNSLRREKSNVKENAQTSKISLTNFNKTINNNSNTNTPLTTIHNNYFLKDKTVDKPQNIINNSPCLKVKRSFSGNSTLKKRNYSEEKIAKDKNNKIGIKITKLKEKVLSNNTNSEVNGYSTFANITISNFRKTQPNIMPAKQLQSANGMKNIFVKK